MIYEREKVWALQDQERDADRAYYRKSAPRYMLEAQARRGKISAAAWERYKASLDTLQAARRAAWQAMTAYEDRVVASMTEEERAYYERLRSLYLGTSRGILIGDTYRHFHDEQTVLHIPSTHEQED